MIRLRARTQGLLGYMWDGLPLHEGDHRSWIIEKAREAEKDLPAPRSRSCESEGCSTLLTRYNPGPLCTHHAWKAKAGRL